MSDFRLFSVFHANLDFSALPDRDLPLVIARCYWPLLSLAEESGLPLGIEMPARTLRRLAREDPAWLASFRDLAERGRVELVASGWAQVVGPLAPVDVNRANLALGRDAYAELMGSVPSTWFVHEQTFSRGLAPLYAEVGARSLVMEWNNPASARPELRPLRFRPARLAVEGGAPIELLWNDCIFFQKLQRAAHAACPPGEYTDAVTRAAGDDGARLLCAYGGDLEIFDYRPGGECAEAAAEGQEMSRLAGCLRAVGSAAGHRFVLPRDATRGLEPGPLVELTAASQPIPCKKQPRYNPTRWAVSGRDGLGMNTRCFALRRELATRAALASGSGACVAPSDLRELVELWGSDYRTRATEEKVDDFHGRVGTAGAALRESLEAWLPKLDAGEDAVLVNASDEPWPGLPVELELRLPPGRLRAARVRAAPEEALPADGSQLEVTSRHRDGSVRCATLVLEPRLAPHQRLGLRLEPGATGGQPQRTASDAGAGDRAETEAVAARFLPHRGGALAQLVFPGIAPHALAGTLPHGSFDAIEYSPDFYSGHVVAITEATEKATDLAPVRGVRRLADGPVRLGLEFALRTPLGDCTKRYQLYRHHPRVDLVHQLHFREARLNSLRLGTLTVLPGALARDTLAYTSVNGGSQPERFALEPGTRLAQNCPASPSVSASSCLGATEGWVSVGDGERGLALIGDRAQAAAVPLLEFSDVDEGYFLRVHHSVAETDETRATFFRGVRRFAFAILGHGDDPRAVREAAGAISRGLAVRTERGVGIARGL